MRQYLENGRRYVQCSDSGDGDALARRTADSVSVKPCFVNAVLLLFSMALCKWQYFVLQLPVDHTVLLNLAVLSHLMHIRDGP